MYFYHFNFLIYKKERKKR